MLNTNIKQGTEEFNDIQSRLLDKKSNNMMIAMELLNELPSLVRDNDNNLYAFNGKCYDLFQAHELECAFNEFVVKFGLQSKFKTSTVNDVALFFRSTSVIPTKEMNAHTNLLCLNNGVLNIDDMSFYEHSEKYYFDTYINIDYDNTQQSCPAFLGYLNHVTNGSKEMTENILRLGGYLLDYSYKNMKRCNKMFIFDGPGGSGKSTLLDVFSLFFSKQQTTNLSLDILAGNNFKKELLLKSRVNFAAEQKRSYMDTEEVKKIISGEAITVEGKYKLPITFNPKTKIILACNGLMKFSDTSEGIYRRLVIFRFQNQYKTKYEYEKIENPGKFHIYLQDRDLAEKLEEEKKSIFNLFLQGLKLLRDDNFYFLEGKETEALLEELRNDNDACREFLKENYVVDSEIFTPVMDIYEDYKQWHREHVHDTLNFKFRSNEMGKRIKEAFNIDVNGRRRFVAKKEGEIIGKEAMYTTYPLRKITYDDTNGDDLSDVPGIESGESDASAASGPSGFWDNARTITDDEAPIPKELLGFDN